MKILSIETSCDETAISLLEVKKNGNTHNFKLLGNEVSSQIALHTQYGGVFPMMAKREHDKNILSILLNVLKESKLYKIDDKKILPLKVINKIKAVIERENFIKENFISTLEKIKKPEIDAIAVTTGPGLEPALWVGISFAKALSILWDIPLVPVNHMEGHVFSIFPKLNKSFTIKKDDKIFPALSLLVSGGHTELVLIKDWQKYKKIGQTRDDAVGEAFDKVARLLGLPYPGGPEISKIANIERDDSSRTVLREVPKDGPFPVISLPRPMINSKDYDFSYSGLKTAVLYMIRDIGELNSEIKQKIAKEFEDAAIEVLVSKTLKAVNQYDIRTVIVGGGVSANKHLQYLMAKTIKDKNLKIKVHFPTKNLNTDNAVMIGIAGYFQYLNKKYTKKVNTLKAKGNLSL